LPTSTRSRPPRAGFDALQQALADWRGGRTSWEHWGESSEGARAAFAAMVGVAPERVAIGATVSEFAGLVAACLPAGARVLVPDIEFTSTLFPFLVQEARGVQVSTVAPIATRSGATPTIVANAVRAPSLLSPQCSQLVRPPRQSASACCSASKPARGGRP